MNLQEIFNYPLIHIGDYHLDVFSVFISIIVIIIARIILWVIQTFLNRRKNQNKLDAGLVYAIYQISKYIIIIISISLVLESVGVKITILLAGSAALLVGIGLGLQQLFHDLVCGIIILIEQGVKVDDVIEVDGVVARVRRIGIRTSKIETRESIYIIIPNSKLVSDKIINWSHNKKFTRFEITVGVKYGSDVTLVSKILLECAIEHASVSKNHKNQAWFSDFGDSALIFKLLFWSDEIFRIENVKSDIRFLINKKFKENNITIPFPQRDVHFFDNQSKK